MADKIYKGKNVRLILDGKKVFHATECNISISVNLESIATKDTSGKISIPSDYEWSATLSALVAEKDPVSLTHHSFTDVVAKTLAMTECDFQYTTDETGDFVFTGKVYINQAEINASTESSASGSFSFTGNGDLNLGEVSGVPVITSDDEIEVTIDVPFTFTVTATRNPTAFAVTVGVLPTGLALNSTTGVISGTYEGEEATGTFTVRASNTYGNDTQVISFSLVE